MADTTPNQPFNFSTTEQYGAVYIVYTWTFIVGQRWEWRFHSMTVSRKHLSIITDCLFEKDIAYQVIKSDVDFQIKKVEPNVY